MQDIIPEPEGSKEISANHTVASVFVGLTTSAVDLLQSAYSRVKEAIKGNSEAIEANKQIALSTDDVNVKSKAIESNTQLSNNSKRVVQTVVGGTLGTVAGLALVYSRIVSIRDGRT